MSQKYEKISKAYSLISREISASPDKWMAFLRTACRNYKLRFDEQLLLYAQRPDATAILEIERWNKAGRMVKRGSKGIAVFENPNGDHQRIKYYFDISDTVAVSKSHRLPLWEMKDEYKDRVINALEIAYGRIAEKNTLVDAVKQGAKQATENISNYFSELKGIVSDSILFGFSETEMKNIFSTTIENSVSYTILSRLSVNADDYYSDDDFRSVTNFSTFDTFNTLGTATASIAKIGLSEIARTVLQAEQESYKTNTIERGLIDERNNIYSAGRLSAPELGTSETAESDIRILRSKTTELSQGESQSDIHKSADKLHTGGSSERDGSESKRNVRSTDKTDGESRGIDRANENGRSDELGSQDEQHLQSRTRDSNVGSNIRIDYYDKSNSDRGLPLFSNDDAIREMFSTTPHIKANKSEIRAFFESSKNEKARTSYIQNIFNNDYTEVILKDGSRVGYKSYSNGLLLWRGSFLSRTAQIFYKWSIIEKYFDAMRLLGELDDKIKPLPSIEGQLTFFKAEEKTSAFSFSQEIIDTVLTRGSGVSEGKFRIYNAYNSIYSAAERAIFLKNEYGIGGCSPVITGTKIGENHNAKGIELNNGFGDTASKFPMKWSYVEKRIGELIKLGRYLTPEESKLYVDWAALQNVESVTGKSEEPHSNEKIKISLDTGKDQVNWIYYNPDADAGGQYISGNLAFSVFEELVEQYDIANHPENVEKFYSDLEEMSDQFLADINTPFFLEAENDYESDCDYIEFTPENILSIHKDILEFNAEHQTELARTASQNELSEAVPETKQLSAYRVGDFYEIYGSEAKKAAEILEIVCTTKADKNGVRRDMCGFPVYTEKQYSDKLIAAGYKIVFYNEESESKAKDTQIAVLPEQKKHSVDLRRNFRIKNDDIGAGKPLERFYHNINAIQLLGELESEHRAATAQEQAVLAEYVGWGGLPQFFEESNPHYDELKNLLSEDDYMSARESALTSFYTPPVVIKAIYKALENMKFQNGNILEPSCGIGNFIGLVPDSIRNNVKFYGVEIDSVSGRIAQQLYPESNIAVQGFEESNLPDSFFDVAIGNVPFGQFKINDRRYDKYNFLIHDYFFAKAIDKIRPGGVIAFITSKGTMDKENPAVRRYIAQRADLIGAIRLPSNTFSQAAGTDVTSDIVFLQKRENISDIDPDWVHLSVNENGIKMNSYFVDNPDMILGEMQLISGPHGMQSSCLPNSEQSLETQLTSAIENMHTSITDRGFENIDVDLEDDSIPADPNVRNFSFTLYDDKIYYRENSRMTRIIENATVEKRIKGLIQIRDCVRDILDMQTYSCSDAELKDQQKELNSIYDKFTKKYGLINSRANKSAFINDSLFPLLSSLEEIDDDGNLKQKAAIFYKRTIAEHITVTSVDTASEALALSIGEKAAVDMEYICKLSGKSEKDVLDELKGVIFLNPLCGFGNADEPKYLLADEYLSGNVRDKLRVAERSEQLYPGDYSENVDCLKKVQPKDLTASEIFVQLGSTWVPVDVIEKFVFEFLNTSTFLRRKIRVNYSKYTAEWRIQGKHEDIDNVKANKTYGTNRINAYEIIEDTLNLKDVRIFDYVFEDNGNRKAVLNKKETAIAQSKQEQIKQGFKDWIWRDPDRRHRLCEIYNEKFNSIRPREYNGSHIIFGGMNPEIELRTHQKDAVAHILYGGNTLLAHVVGAGKTFEMVAAAMESKRLGLCSKSLFVVPNHLTEQWAAEFMQLYPAANILVATKKDFKTKSRKKFCGRIATGDYDAVIIGHSQFEKIPMSIERQKLYLKRQIDEVTDGISELARKKGNGFSVKQLEKTRKSLRTKLEKLSAADRKDDVVTFEELGVDRLFVDESHYYKNLYLYTKMRNVGGVAQTEAQKSSDLFMKCRYIDEITGGRGIVFATGTPISNSMVELYTIQRYLQYDKLRKYDLQHFDAWAATYGETVTAIELTPEGTGYRAKTRFAKFNNLPELMSMFREVADIKTADMLNLPVPEVEYKNISVKPSKIQKDMVNALSKRAEKVRKGVVEAWVDNMLKITNDGRKLALDQRLIDPLLPDFEGSKVNACVDNVYRIWAETAEKRLTQLIFCDLSTPKNNDSFSVYDDIRKKLVGRGVPEAEIKFIHEAKTEAGKQDLFKKVRRGDVRVLIGSTAKMGAGTNVQDKIIASHDLDCPWRPSDLEQRAGRTVRQGNENPKVQLYRYVTEETFDAYLYQIVEGKQKFASQIMTSKSPVRSADDIDETALSYAEIKMLATGNPHIKEKMDLDIQVQKLRLLKSSYLSEKYELEDLLVSHYPKEIARLTELIIAFKADIITAQEHPKPADAFIGMEIKGHLFKEKAEAGQCLIDICRSSASEEPVFVANYRGFKIAAFYNCFEKTVQMKLVGKTSRVIELGHDPNGNITKIDNAIDKLPERLAAAEAALEDMQNQYNTAKTEAKKPFPREDELTNKLNRLNEINHILGLDKQAAPTTAADKAPDYEISVEDNFDF